MPEKIASLKKDVNDWYNDVIIKAELADYATVRGMMIIRPYGFDIWRRVQDVLGGAIRESGTKDAYFPLMIPESFLKREAKHVEGFAPEIAWVTEGGGKELPERLAVRPTSETIMYDTFSRWIHSHRDLPLKINQWANVVRWEKRTKLFLRTTEFLWQEGHTVHASLEEADAETMRALQMYEAFCRDWLAMPVLTGRKTESEKFAGALYTTSIEALLLDGKALQAGTSHNLGQNFAKVFKIQYADESGALQSPWQTSWGMSSRIIGGLILTHGDERGLVLPPKIAPIQVVIVPICKTPEEKNTVSAECDALYKKLLAAGVRVEFDQRDGVSPGFKYNHWEVRGVPVRVEIGPRDLKEKKIMLVSRLAEGKAGKKSIDTDTAVESITELLGQIQIELLERATKYRDEHTTSVESYDEFKKVIDDKKGFVRAGWCGDAECEATIKTETKATIRVLPFEQKNIPATCLREDKPAKHVAIFARAH